MSSESFFTWLNFCLNYCQIRNWQQHVSFSKHREFEFTRNFYPNDKLSHLTGYFHIKQIQGVFFFRREYTNAFYYKFVFFRDYYNLYYPNTLYNIIICNSIQIILKLLFLKIINYSLRFHYINYRVTEKKS